MDGYTVAWVGWLVMFGVIEGAALLDKRKNDTLSEHVWDWFAIKDKPKGWKVRRGGLYVFLAWLVAHFVTGGAV